MIENRDFEIFLPALDGRGEDETVTVSIPMEWDEEIQEWLMTEEGVITVEEIKRQHFEGY